MRLHLTPEDRTFRDELRFRGPERFPHDALVPGQT